MPGPDQTAPPAGEQPPEPDASSAEAQLADLRAESDRVADEAADDLPLRTVSIESYLDPAGVEHVRIGIAEHHRGGPGFDVTAVLGTLSRAAFELQLEARLGIMAAGEQ